MGEEPIMWELTITDTQGDEIIHQCDDFSVQSGDTAYLYTIVKGSGVNPLDKRVLTTIVKFTRIDIREIENG